MQWKSQWFLPRKNQARTADFACNVKWGTDTAGLARKIKAVHHGSEGCWYLTEIYHSEYSVFTVFLLTFTKCFPLNFLFASQSLSVMSKNPQQAFVKLICMKILTQSLSPLRQELRVEQTDGIFELWGYLIQLAKGQLKPGSELFNWVMLWP